MILTKSHYSNVCTVNVLVVMIDALLTCYMSKHHNCLEFVVLSMTYNFVCGTVPHSPAATVKPSSNGVLSCIVAAVSNLIDCYTLLSVAVKNLVAPHSCTPAATIKLIIRGVSSCVVADLPNLIVLLCNF